jgi:hypothetical protein
MTISRFRAVSTLLAVAICLTLAVPAGTAAAAPSADRLLRDLAASSDARAAFEALSPAQQQEVLAQVQVAKVVTEAPAPTPMLQAGGGFAPLAGGCWTVTWGRSGYNNFGYELFSLKQKIDWCGNGSTLTSVARTHWVEVYMFGWSGTIIQDPTWGGVGQWSFRAFTQADFVLNIVYPWQHVYPWLDMTVTAAGGLSGSGGGT